MIYDVILWDDVSAPFNPRIADERGLGGVEWTFILLAGALARDGLRVLVLSKGPTGSYDGVEYDHISRAYAEALSCRALVVSRWSQVPPVEHRRLVFSYHDVPERWVHARHQRWLDQGALAVCVSSWQARKLEEIGPSWFTRVIAPMLLDECYEGAAARDERRFVYASAAVKGLTPTLDTWALLKESFRELDDAEMLVATNGYDDPSEAHRARRLPGVCFVGQAPARRIIAALRSSAGLFFVNDYPETHCMIASTALALGVRCHVLAQNDPAALPETLAGSPLFTRSRHDFIEQFVQAYLSPRDPRWVLPRSDVPDRRAAALLPAWKEVLFG